VRTDAIRPAVVAVTDDAAPPLSPAQTVLFGMVREPVLKLAAVPLDPAVLNEIGRVITRVLDLIQDDEHILHAADHLYEAAFALHDIWGKRSRSRRITEEAVASRAEALQQALVRFRVSVCRAKPNARGRAWRSEW
jgi:hypothetical protein